MKLKVGDRCRQITGRSIGDSEMVTITKIEGDKVYHLHDIDGTKQGHEWYTSEAAFELIEPEVQSFEF